MCRYVYVLSGLFSHRLLKRFYVALHSSLTVCTRITRPGPPGAPHRTNSGPPERDGGKINTAGTGAVILTSVIHSSLHAFTHALHARHSSTKHPQRSQHTPGSLCVHLCMCVEISDRTSPNMLATVTFKMNKLTNKYSNKPIELLIFVPL